MIAHLFTLYSTVRRALSGDDARALRASYEARYRERQARVAAERERDEARRQLSHATGLLMAIVESRSEAAFAEAEDFLRPKPGRMVPRYPVATEHDGDAA